MGRTWDALRRGGSAANDIEQSRAIPTPVTDEGPMLADAEEIPFIEVGPHKSMEASPSVLACSPSLRGEGREARGEKERVSLAPPEPRRLLLHTVFLAAPETPQTDGAA